MATLMLIWLALIACFLYLASRKDHLSPLLLAYVAALSTIHAPGAFNYLGSDEILSGREETELGFAATLVGMGALLVGALLGRARIKQFHPHAQRNSAQVGDVAESTPYDYRALGVMMVVIGFFTYFVGMPVASMLPSVSSLLSPLGGLLIVGVWFYVYDICRRRDLGRLAVVLVLLPLLPASTLLLGGFMGYGVGWMLCILAVIYCFWPRRTVFVAFAPLMAYVGLSFAAAYFQERGEIREVIWGERAALEERIASTLQIFEALEPYDLTNPDHVYVIDDRLNQNSLVGLGILSHRDGLSNLYYGSTVPLWSLIPRALWPDKPQVGGGLDLVSEFTGLTFADGTSVGTGHVLESYMNFGWLGIIIGFLVLGFLLARLDRMLVDGFARQDLRAILVSGLVGLSLLGAGGNMMEAFVASVASVIVGLGLAMVLKIYIARHASRFAARRPTGPMRQRMGTV